MQRTYRRLETCLEIEPTESSSAAETSAPSSEPSPTPTSWPSKSPAGTSVDRTITVDKNDLGDVFDRTRYCERSEYIRIHSAPSTLSASVRVMVVDIEVRIATFRKDAVLLVVLREGSNDYGKAVVEMDASFERHNIELHLSKALVPGDDYTLFAYVTDALNSDTWYPELVQTNGQHAVQLVGGIVVEPTTTTSTSSMSTFSVSSTTASTTTSLREHR